MSTEQNPALLEGAEEIAAYLSEVLGKEIGTRKIYTMMEPRNRDRQPIRNDVPGFGTKLVVSKAKLRDHFGLPPEDPNHGALPENVASLVNLVKAG